MASSKPYPTHIVSLDKYNIRRLSELDDGARFVRFEVSNYYSGIAIIMRYTKSNDRDKLCGDTVAYIPAGKVFPHFNIVISKELKQNMSVKKITNMLKSGDPYITTTKLSEDVSLFLNKKEITSNIDLFLVPQTRGIVGAREMSHSDNLSGFYHKNLCPTLMNSVDGLLPRSFKISYIHDPKTKMSHRFINHEDNVEYRLPTITIRKGMTDAWVRHIDEIITDQYDDDSSNTWIIKIPYSVSSYIYWTQKEFGSELRCNIHSNYEDAMRQVAQMILCENQNITQLKAFFTKSLIEMDALQDENNELLNDLEENCPEALLI